MYNNSGFSHFITLALGLCLYLSSFTLCHANTRDESKVWTDVTVEKEFQPKYHAYISTRLQSDLDENRTERYRFVGALGYQWLPHLSVWLGYQFNTTNQITNAPGGYRFFEQLFWQIYKCEHYRLSLRSRLEERKRLGRSEWVIELRERVTLSLPHTIHPKITPVIYDEVFFTFKSSDWLNNQGLIQQNRFFIGLRFPITKHIEFEPGYLNRIRWRTTQSILENIIAINLLYKLPSG